MKNQSFRPDYDNPHQNALVGGSWPGDIDHAYREGFRQATQVLLAAAASGSYTDPATDQICVIYVDALVYPICFNARHFIELFLKDSIRAVSALGFNAQQATVRPVHDLAVLWAKFEAAIARDKRLAEFGMPLKEVFQDIAQVDAKGATFRYSRDRDNQPHLPGIEHISLSVLGDRLRRMFEQTEVFDVCISALKEEYAQNTFTKKLNRSDIETIARRLPPYENWREKLPSVKKVLCDEYRISSNDFAKALNLIKAHREFSSLIGRELPLEGVPTDVFVRLGRIHDRQAGYDSLTVGEWLRLEAILEVSRSFHFSELYDGHLNAISQPDHEHLFDPAHVLRNAYARNQRLREGLLKLGQPTLLQALARAIPHLAEPLKTPPRRSKKELAELSTGMIQRLKPIGASPENDGGSGPDGG